MLRRLGKQKLLVYILLLVFCVLSWIAAFKLGASLKYFVLMERKTINKNDVGWGYTKEEPWQNLYR